MIDFYFNFKNDINWYSILIPTAISCFCMFLIDNRSRKRWLYDGVTKKYISNLMESRQTIIDTNNIIRYFIQNLTNKSSIYYNKDFYKKLNKLYNLLDEINTLTNYKNNEKLKQKNDKIINCKHNLLSIELFFREFDFLCWSNFKKYKDNRDSSLLNLLEIDQNIANIALSDEFIKVFQNLYGKHIITKEYEDKVTIINIKNLEDMKNFILNYIEESEELCDVIDSILKTKNIESYL